MKDEKHQKILKKRWKVNLCWNRWIEWMGEKGFTSKQCKKVICY